MMKNTRGGFTLVELLIAISVLAIVAVLGWRGLDSIVRARVALNNDLTQTRGLQLAFAQMQTDASNIVKPDSIAGRSPIAARSGSITLVRTVFADNQPSRLQVISYRVRDGVLSRRESTATRDLTELDTLWTAALGDTDNAQPVVLQSGVDAMTVRTWNDGVGWRATDAAAQGGANPSGAAPPTGLEVALQLSDRADRLLKIFLLGAV